MCVFYHQGLWELIFKNIPERSSVIFPLYNFIFGQFLCRFSVLLVQLKQAQIYQYNFVTCNYFLFLSLFSLAMKTCCCASHIHTLKPHGEATMQNLKLKNLANLVSNVYNEEEVKIGGLRGIGYDIGKRLGNSDKG